MRPEIPHRVEQDLGRHYQFLWAPFSPRSHGRIGTPAPVVVSDTQLAGVWGDAFSVIIAACAMVGVQHISRVAGSMLGRVILWRSAVDMPVIEHLSCGRLGETPCGQTAFVVGKLTSLASGQSCILDDMRTRRPQEALGRLVAAGEGENEEDEPPGSPSQKQALSPSVSPRWWRDPKCQPEPVLLAGQYIGRLHAFASRATTLVPVLRHKALQC